MSETVHKETHAFQTEVKQILELMIHSLYSNKEIFLRELVSNASDAADKLRFEALSDDALFENDADLNVTITIDKDARTLTLRDNGIGMSRQEVIDNIGTIARSGTRAFLESLSGDAKQDANLIGQFGVGFYSAFIVADRVTLTTRRAGLTAEHGVRWESKGDGEYSLETIERGARGTEITLHLREGEDEFLESFRLQSIIRKYSDHIPFPIRMPKEGEDAEGFETVNEASALWTRPKSEISEEEYESFYKHVAHDFEGPLAHLHQRLEGKYEYTLLLYLPKSAPFDLWQAESKHGVKLYVRRVFIMEAGEELMPRYLRFVRGVMDTSDLPLNVSREILQQSGAVEAMKKGAVKRVLGLLSDLAADDTEKYAGFWSEFGNALKEGIVEDFTNRDEIAKLLRFSTTESDEQGVSLADYVGRMQEGQEKIYYITAETLAAAKGSPQLEIFRKKGIEVLLLHDRIDEWLTSHLTEFEGKKLQSVARGQIDVDELGADEKVDEKQEKANEKLAGKVAEVLGERVKQVRPTSRLVDSAACLVSDEFDISTNLERILRQAGQEVPQVKPILEINPEHPLLARLAKSRKQETIEDLASVVFDEAVLAEGGKLEDPAGFVARINRLLV